MIIDSHHHFWNYSPERDTWIEGHMGVLKRDFGPSDLYPMLSAHGVAGAITVQTAHSEEETLHLLALAARHDFIKGVIGWTDLCAPQAHDRLQALGESGYLKGIRHLVQFEPQGFMARADFRRGVQLLSPLNLSYDVLLFHHQLPEAVDFCAALDQQVLVIDHLAKPVMKPENFDFWARHMRQLGAMGHTFCKLSGLVTEASWQTWKKEDFRPYLDTVFEAFGEDRLLFGSDWPVCLLAASYEQVLDLVFSYMQTSSADTRQKVMAQNAVKVYGLDVPELIRA
ncbi:MAG: amidohydrolase family protein [Cytophagales bacterium]|nr:amidohydrolase family protein [Cytophagales bacterium]